MVNTLDLGKSATTPLVKLAPSKAASDRKKSIDLTRRQLAHAIQGANDVLATANTTLTIFPDTLTVDRTKLTVTKRKFLQTAEVMSLRVEDILNVIVSVGPFLGQIQIFSRVFTQEVPETVGKFWRNDALRLKRIIQGYVVALQQQIDCSSMPTEELSQMLDDLGKDEHQAKQT